MHAFLNVDEIIRLIASELVTSGERGAAVALAYCRKSFEDPVLDALWEVQDHLYPLLKSFPGEIWDEKSGGIFVSTPRDVLFLPLNLGKSLKRIPTEAQWTRFRKYARRIRALNVNPSQGSLPPNILSVLQHHTLNAPLLPGLNTFVCREATAAFIPFIPLFLSSRTTIIDIGFAEFLLNPPTLMIASVIATLSTVCPDLREVRLHPLPRATIIATATSEMLLTCNRNTLRNFAVDAIPTEAARKVLYQLPNLSGLRSLLLGSTSPFEVLLPNLTALGIAYHQGHRWLRVFHGATLSKLTKVAFDTEWEPIGDFLEAFENFAVATSASATLSEFAFYTTRSWSPNYHSLLSFKQLKRLTIESSCDNGCSSRVDDEIIIILARAMPKMEDLRLGSEPCQTPNGVTVKGLVELARCCTNLTTLRVHIRADSLVQAAADGAAPSPSDGKLTTPRGECALTTLEVGSTPIPEESALTVALALLHIFLRISRIKYTNAQWRVIAKTIKTSKQLSNRIGALTRSSGKNAHTTSKSY